MSRGLFGRLAGGAGSSPRADGGYQQAGVGVEIDLGNPEHVMFLRGQMSAAGVAVTEAGAMRIAAAWRCVHLISGTAGNMPFSLMERVSDRERRPASGHPSHQLVSIRPNGWQTPQDFKRTLTAHVALRGNGYGLKITSMGRVIEVWPVHPDRMRPVQLADMSIIYRYTRNNGSTIDLPQSDVFHLRGLSLDGVVGLGALEYARTTMGLALQTQNTAARMFKQGNLAGGALKTPMKLSPEVFDRLKASLDEKHSGAENAHKWMILEEGLDVANIAMSAADMQFLEERKFERSDIAMFFGVPPFMIGDTEKSTSWGAGIEQQKDGYVSFTAEDYLTAWEEAGRRDLLSPADALKFYFRFNRASLVRGDIKTRWAAHVQALQWGVYSPNEIRELEDRNPREGGDVFYPPPNTAGTPAGEQDPTDDPTNPATKP